MKDSTKMLSLKLNEASSKRNEVPPEHEYDDNEKSPKSLHLRLLPPCQSAFNFDNLFVDTVPVNNAIAVYYLLFYGNRTFLWLILEGMEQRTVRIDSGIRNGK